MVARRGVEVERNTDKGRCPLCLGEKDVKHTLLDCFKTRNWRQKVLSEKWLNRNKEIAYWKILRSTNKDQIRNLGRSFENIKYKW
jgi:hypothetical protein